VIQFRDGCVRNEYNSAAVEIDRRKAITTEKTREEVLAWLSMVVQPPPLLLFFDVDNGKNKRRQKY